jgi:hypothetical protein
LAQFGNFTNRQAHRRQAVGSFSHNCHLKRAGGRGMNRQTTAKRKCCGPSAFAQCWPKVRAVQFELVIYQARAWFCPAKESPDLSSTVDFKRKIHWWQPY